MEYCFVVFSFEYPDFESGFDPSQTWVYCSWWQHAANLASYEQQDAHEFFISMLDGIHEKVKERGKPQSQGNFLQNLSFFIIIISEISLCMLKL